MQRAQFHAHQQHHGALMSQRGAGGGVTYGGGGLGLGGGLGGVSHVGPDQFSVHTHSQFVPSKRSLSPPGGMHFGGVKTVACVSNPSILLFNPSFVAFKASMRLDSPASTPLSSASVAFNPSILLFNPTSSP